MPDPYNYDTTGAANPISGVLQGLQAGYGQQQAAFQQQQNGVLAQEQQLQLQQRQQQMQAQQAQQQELQKFYSIKNPTVDDYANIATRIPSLSENFKRVWDMRSTDQQQSDLQNVGQVHAALANGRPDFALGLVNDRLSALKNSGGDPQQIHATEALSNIIKQNPDFALKQTGLSLAMMPGGDKVIGAISGYNTDTRNQQLQPAAVAKANAEANLTGTKAAVEAATAPDQVAAARLKNDDMQSQITDRTNRFGLDTDKLTTDTQVRLSELGQKYGQLPEAVMSKVDAATTDAIASQQSATKMTDLASRIEKAGAGLGGGPMASVDEAFKRATGNTDEYTRLRNEFSRMVTPAAMAQYKRVASGSTSDKDIDTAMVGVPKPTDPASMMASYLRGAAKLQVYDSVMKNAESEWLGANKFLGKATKDIEVDGVRVPAGTSFKDFTDRFVDAQVKAKIGQQTVQSRSYMRFATPGQ